MKVGETMQKEDGNLDNIQWQTSVPIFRNTVILKQLGLAIGLPFGFLALILVLSSGKSIYTLYALGLIGTLLLLTWVFIMAVYGGKYEVEFLLDEKGAFCCTQTRQARRNRIINTLAIIFGLITGKPTLAGAGILAQSRQKEFIQWTNVKTVTYESKHNMMILKGNFPEKMALFCTAENYELVKRYVNQAIKL